MLAGKLIMVVEDEFFLRRSLAQYLESKQADVSAAENLAEARELVRQLRFDFVLLDINLPDGNGLEFLREGLFAETTQVVMMTAEGGIRTAIEAIQSGAADYLSKPFEPEALPMVFSRIARDRSLQRIKEFEQDRNPVSDANLFVGNRLNQVKAQLHKILDADRRLGNRLPPVLIEGETGTGKSTFARWLHQNGPRAKAPLVEVNGATLPDHLAESELFGHERGAFTDARKERIGLFEAADGGTLFLDEISSLSPAIQAKVLIAIEEGKIRRLGSNQARSVDVRLIAASLHPLKQLVAEKAFREDLYHRLNLLHLQIPPLRGFPADLPVLTEHLLAPLKQRYRQPNAELSDAALARICAYPWPGNVRELLHELERAMVFADSGRIDLEHLPLPGSTQTTTGATAPADGQPHSLLNPLWSIPENGYDFEADLKALTRKVIEAALARTDGNVSAAARLLGVPRDFIRYRQ